MGSATITSKGQVTLPAEIRREFDLQAGDRLVFFRALSGDLRLHISRKRVGAGRAGIAGKSEVQTRDAIGSAVAAGVAKRRQVARKTPRKRTAS